MDTLCSDLLNTIAAFSKASEVHILNLKNLDSSEYLKLYTYYSRYALACANRNYHWILQYFDRIDESQRLILAVKYDLAEVEVLLPKFKLPVSCEDDRYNYHNIGEPGEDTDFAGIFNDMDLENELITVVDEEFIRILVSIIYKYDRPHQKQLINKLLVDESMQYNFGYIQYISGFRNIPIPKITLYYVLGLHAGGHIDHIRNVDKCIYLDIRDIDCVLFKVKDISLAEMIIKTIKEPNIFNLSHRLMMHYIKNDMIDLLKYYHLDRSTLKMIVKAKKPELIERQHLLKYDDVYVAVLGHYAKSNNIPMLDQLFDTVPKIDLFIETLYERYPKLSEYVEQKFKQVYGSRFDIDDLKIVYKKADPDSEDDDSESSNSDEEEIEASVDYNLLIKNKDFQSLDTSGFYDHYRVNKFGCANEIIETNSLKFIRLIIGALIKNDCIDYKQPQVSRYFDNKNGSFFLNLEHYCTLKIKELRLVAKSLNIPTSKRLKKDIIIDLIQYIF